MLLALTLNGRPREIAVASRISLADMLRESSFQEAHCAGISLLTWR